MISKTPWALSYDELTAITKNTSLIRPTDDLYPSCILPHRSQQQQLAP